MIDREHGVKVAPLPSKQEIRVRVPLLAHAPVAQSVEQQTFNLRVTGSIPVGRTGNGKNDL